MTDWVCLFLGWGLLLVLEIDANDKKRLEACLTELAAVEK
jgi:hypothetical protein